ncbi:hypothetical protein M8C21_024770 [Ambrosia artemisiifolia]|uniref:protein-serine/threonine phosphatase n=1 Tax=Ambrosia artemisiifolia TaxID=4212 RepID=A0AAD5CI33_AMBAR|nr:hypothetical protein M8C21_024770 [Ambrosia artemisiifolia]
MCTVAILNSPVFSPESCSSSPSFKFRLPKSPVTGIFRASNDDVSNCLSNSPTQLKRKRPTRLNIPIAPLSFSADQLMTVETAVEDRWKEVEVEEEEYSVYCKRGRREKMEDRFKADVDFSGKNKLAFFGVFDGHGGSKAAEYASENLQKNIRDEVEKRGEMEIAEAIKQGYLNTDSEFLKEDQRGGACCVTAIISSGNLVVSNAGDCRAVVSRGGDAEALTSDHRPSRSDEKERIESLGGYVDCSRGVSRVLGSLAVSRGIGDRSLKQWITAEPETKMLKIIPEFEFLIMASDGLWEKVTNQEAVDLARPLCASGDKSETISACKKLVELSTSRGSIDDTSVMIVQLGRFCS